MKLADEEEAMRAGECGAAAQWAIEHQIAVGRYLGARDFVPVTQAHIMADTESLGPTGGHCAFRPSPIRAAPILPPPIGSSSSPGCSISSAARSPRSRRSAC
jgi:Aconitase X